MKISKIMTGAALVCGILAGPVVASAAASQTAGDAKKAKPYPLKTCVVSGEKLGGDMGKPYVFVQHGQEVKLCCKNCLKDFNNEPAKYLKKIAEANTSGAHKPTAGAAHDHSAHQH